MEWNPVRKSRSAYAGLIAALFFGGPSAVRAQCPSYPYSFLTMSGASSFDQFGASAASVGDVNGDGIPDLLVGAPFADPSGLSAAGQAVLLAGGIGTVLLTVNGAASGDLMGQAVAGSGDLNGDTVGDLLVGAPNADPAGLSAAGEVLAISGATGGVLYSLAGTSPSDRFGQAVCVAGDVNADGVPDLLVGAPYASPLGLSMAGLARVFSGSSGAPIFPLPLIGSAVNQNFGYSVAGPGDVDGDGIADLFIGAPTSSQAKVFSGATGALLLTVSGMGYLGRSVAGPGDINGDGTPDLLAGDAMTGGAAYSGVNGTVLFAVSGGVMAGPGDVTLDGVPDALVGRPAQGQAAVYSGLSGVQVASFGTPPLGSGCPTTIGMAVAGAGDINSDGVVDMLVGEPYANPAAGLDCAGQVKVWSFVAYPAGSTSFGAGCPGSNGASPAISANGVPCLGSSVGISLSGALSGTPAILIGGASSTSWLGGPLPLDLGPLGIPGCFLRVSVDALLPTTTTGPAGAGGASFWFTIPTSSTLLGQFAFFQWYVVDPGPFAIPGVTSPGLQVLLG
ncbi:MAG TPA: integrin alpha [Planctomycetota bacterium]|jgi:hypothetical protein|nr:integrin alpha [Planctomycetota bacterium]